MTETMPHAFALPNYETFRETAEKAVSQAKNTYEKAKVASEQATDLLRKTYATAAKGATDYNLKIIEFARANTNTAFDYAQDLMEVPHLGHRELSPIFGDGLIGQAAVVAG